MEYEELDRQKRIDSIKVEFKGNFMKVFKVFIILDELITPFYIDNFANRIKIQKTIFLLQLEGIDFDYQDYDLYLRGVYSPNLTKDMFVFKRAMEKLGFENSWIINLENQLKKRRKRNE
ncbi:MAG: hypothetical protein HZR80_21055 [Candidatus Heimdallarchaeota archaeon]